MTNTLTWPGDISITGSYLGGGGTQVFPSAGELWVTAAPYSASGNGTTDAANAVAAASTAATATGAVLCFPPGTYRLSHNVTLGRCVFAPGAVLKFDAGQTATFTGAFYAAPGPLFDVSAGSFCGPIFSVRPPQFYAEWFGAIGDGTTDDTRALRALGNTVAACGGGRIELAQGRTYRVFPAGTWPSYGSQILFDLSNCRGVTLNGNGATLSVGDVLAASQQVILFYLFTVVGVRVNDLVIAQDNPSLANAQTYGTWAFVVSGYSTRIRLENIKQTGGMMGLNVRGEWPLQQYRASGITMLNCEFNFVYYPQSFQSSGDNYFARNVRTICCGRAYFPFNVRDHDVQLYSEPGGQFDDVVLKVYGYLGRDSALQNIKVDYSTSGRHPSGLNEQASGALVVLALGQWADVGGVSVAGPGLLSDIDVRVNVSNLGTSPSTAKVFNIRKNDKTDSAADTVGRAHNIVNVRLSGRCNVGTVLTSGTVVDLFADPTYGWSGDFAQNVVVEDFAVNADPSVVTIAAGGAPFPPGFTGLTLRNVSTNGQITRTGFAGKPQELQNVASVNLVVQDQPVAFTPTWGATGTAPALGNGTLTGQLYRRGQRCTAIVDLTIGSTTTLGTGAWYFDAPAALGPATVSVPAAGVAFDTSAAAHAPLASEVTVASPPRIVARSGSGDVGATAPYAWAVGDRVRLTAEWVEA